MIHTLQGKLSSSIALEFECIPLVSYYLSRGRMTKRSSSVTRVTRPSIRYVGYTRPRVLASESTQIGHRRSVTAVRDSFRNVGPLCRA